MMPLGDILKGGPPGPTLTLRTSEPACALCMGLGKVWRGEGFTWCSCPIGEWERRQAWLEASGIPKARWGETIATFKALPGTEESLAATKKFISGSLLWLFIYGDCGNGKSHLANAAVLACLDSGKRARLVNALFLLSELGSVRWRPEFKEQMDLLASVPVLIIDELFWATDLEGRWLEEVIQRRYGAKRPLLVTTNKDIKEFPQPIISRFHELGKIVLNKGKDYRREKR